MAERIYILDPLYRGAVRTLGFVNRDKGFALAIESANRGKISPNSVYEMFGIRGLAKIDPDLIVNWIPIIQVAIERSWNQDRFSPNEVEQFFAGFPFKDALPHLLNALNCTCAYPTDKISEKVIGLTEVEANVRRGEEYSYGGWRGSYAGYYEYYDVYLADLIEETFTSRRPVSEGAKKSLLLIAQKHPELAQKISEAVSWYDENPRETFAKMVIGPKKVLIESDRKRSVTTEEDHTYC